MTKLERMKIELIIRKAQTAKAELELKIMERLEDIERMEDHIKSQEQIISESKLKLED